MKEKCSPTLRAIKKKGFFAGLVCVFLEFALNISPREKWKEELVETVRKLRNSCTTQYVAHKDAQMEDEPVERERTNIAEGGNRLLKKACNIE